MEREITMRFIKRLPDIMATACAGIEESLLSAMTVMVFFQVITRYFFGYSIAWIEELTRYFMIWMAYLGSAVLFKDNDHIRMDLIFRKLPVKYQDYLYILFELIQIAFLVMLFKLGLNYSESLEILTSTSLRISMRWPVLIIPVAAILMIVFIMTHMIKTIVDLKRKTSSDL
jgi:TRAP-type C4-dicarboxylate transport system permease small subunit